ncbi:unnamed protein product [Lathyrus oleraceus]
MAETHDRLRNERIAQHASMRREKSQLSNAFVHSGHADASTFGAHVSTHASPSSSSHNRRVSPTDASLLPSSRMRQVSPIQAPKIPKSAMVPEAPVPPPTEDASKPVPPPTADDAELVPPPNVGAAK